MLKGLSHLALQLGGREAQPGPCRAALKGGPSPETLPQLVFIQLVIKRQKKSLCLRDVITVILPWAKVLILRARQLD